MDAAMLIAIASDHAGFAYKQAISEWLRANNHKIRDFGTSSDAPCDYPLFIRPAAEAVAQGVCERGIVLGGSGNGEAIVANRVKGVRCAYCFNLETARLGREHNNANAISIGQRMIPIELAIDIVKVFLETGFAGERHARRIAMIDAPDLKD
jgi:ribose 5-phosphate isomerase B